MATTTAAGLPPTQRAWRAHSWGKPEDVVKLDKDVPVPHPEKGEVLVQTKAAALNPVYYKLLAFLPNVLFKRPAVVESDLAGVVVDPNGSSWKVGDEVLGIIPADEAFKTGKGAIAEYTTPKADLIVHKPKNISWEEAAGVPLTGQTAYEALLEPTKNWPGLQPGDRLFINGGSTTVGLWAIQIAKVKGASFVAVSCSSRNFDLVKSVGANEAIDYTTGPLPAQLEASFSAPDKQFDLVLDCIASPDVFKRSPAYLKEGKPFVCIGGDIFSAVDAAKLVGTIARPRILGGTPREFRYVLFKASQDKLLALTKLIEEGNIKTIVDSVYPFHQVPEAYKKLKSGRARGKVVVKID